MLVPGTSAARAAEDAPAELHLVTFGPGAGAEGDQTALVTARRRLLSVARQQRALDAVGAPDPVYRWHTALDGAAVQLTDEQARDLRTDPDVDLVEPDRVLRLAGAPAPSPVTAAETVRTDGGAGVTIGMVDSGLAPEGPVFASVPELGPAPRGFRGTCAVGEDWESSDCGEKVVGARWFVEGFGSERVRSSASLSARDDSGHGTALASLAAGNARVSARAGREDLGSFSGVAPQARLAIYKACWSAPDPEDDGCAVADLVTAVDRAVADGVEVLNLAVATATGHDTLQLALLGAAEADVVVVAAAGNDGVRGQAGHAVPWVTTVGAAQGVVRQGRVVVRGGPRLDGAMASARRVPAARVVLASTVPAAGAGARQARVCAPGSLDAGRVAGRIVVCERGRVGRVDKSAAVEQADGVGMVLLNTRRQPVAADLHSVPTVHLDAAAGRTLQRWVRRHPQTRVTLSPDGRTRSPRVVLPWSSAGDPAAPVLKPDVVAPGAGMLAAVPGPRGTTSAAWDYVQGTSAATAYTSGAAALLLDRHRWPAATVRSALATSAEPVRGPVLRTGAGRVDPETALRPALAHEVDPADYRRWLEGRLRGELNTPSILLHDGAERARRTITNTGRRTLYFSSSASGFTTYDVTVTPAAVRLDPGESATYTVRATGPAGRRPTDDGTITWRGANGTSTRVPVLLTR
ncbi:S8 family serine peptidase [Nocardioides pantholopis]|uniref:S8 family serine peptidase n=1 Tax=Nocardioides pantholopis TaxID=2483798 RepID=UPI0013E40214|nr:S8 family serine peptidase [Nocardioides pantholopis]